MIMADPMSNLKYFLSSLIEFISNSEGFFVVPLGFFVSVYFSN